MLLSIGETGAESECARGEFLSATADTKGRIIGILAHGVGGLLHAKRT